MKKNFSQNFIKVGILLAVIIAGLATNYIYAAWSNPPGDPTLCPDGYPGCDSPLNVGIVNQVKDAGLSLLSLVVNGPVQIQDGTEGDGKVLVSDADGIASWQDVSGIGGGTTYFTWCSLIETRDPGNLDCYHGDPENRPVAVVGAFGETPPDPMDCTLLSDIDGGYQNVSWRTQSTPRRSYNIVPGESWVWRSDSYDWSAECVQTRRTSGGGGTASLPTCADGEALKFDAGSASWICAAPGAAIGTSCEFERTVVLGRSSDGGNGARYDACHTRLSPAARSEGWLSTGSDACAEDGSTCTDDGLTCYYSRVVCSGTPLPTDSTEYYVDTATAAGFY